MDIGRTLIVVGVVILAIGIVLTFADRVPPLGRLPGDFTVQGDHWTVYAPLATSIVLSIVLTLALNLVAWLARR
ncbi:MAG TPA: DUF2905 domain-containing protein [Candidatus Limnocylindria bacterium]|nr:DUF2905 domain-containing protein [Candidatus Limnocylindria bacterium]